MWKKIIMRKGENMNATTINLKDLQPVGNIKTEMLENEILSITTTRAIHSVGYNIKRDRIISYMRIPGKFRLPMRIDIECSIDMPEILLFIGLGHVTIGSPWMENRRIEDISEQRGKPLIYDNHIPYNEFVGISIIYNLKEMQILINGEERYYSTKERYMKSKDFPEQNESGFELGITCTKRAKLDIRSINVTEYEDKVPLTHIETENKEPDRSFQATQKHTFDSCIENLPPDIKEEIIKTDKFLKSLNNLKFKRIIEKHGNKITYVESNIGISYAIYLSGNIMHHSIQYYVISNCKPEFWHRKTNDMEAVLNEIEKTSPHLAERIFYNLNECVGCGPNCLSKTPYTYKSQKKVSCHGMTFFKMCIPDFEDIRDFFKEVNKMYSE